MDLVTIVGAAWRMYPENAGARLAAITAHGIPAAHARQYAEGQPCKRGERADRTKCIPKSSAGVQRASVRGEQWAKDEAASRSKATREKRKGRANPKEDAKPEEKPQSAAQKAFADDPSIKMLSEGGIPDHNQALEKKYAENEQGARDFMKKSPRYKQAVDQYTDGGPWFGKVNKALRGGGGFAKLKGDTAWQAKALNHLASQPLKTPMVVYRGIQGDSAIAKALLKMGDGEEFTGQGIESWSHDAGVSHGFAAPAKEKSKAPRVMLRTLATKGAYLGNKGLSKFRESELVRPHGSKYRVVGKTLNDPDGEDPMWVLDVEEA